jgi:hypothetical protein
MRKLPFAGFLIAVAITLAVSLAVSVGSHGNAVACSDPPCKPK